MAYTRKPQTLGDLSSTISNIVAGAGTAADLLADPYFAEVVCRLGQIKAIERRQPVPACAKTPLGIPGGAGLQRAVVPLRAYVYAQQNQWVYPVAIGAAIGLPILLGYYLGKGKR